MMILKHTSKPNPRAAAANVIYITRTSACADIDFYNLEHLRGTNLQESRTNAIAFAETRMIEEAHRKHGGRGASRNHMRAVFSFDRKVDAAKAREFVKGFIAKELPDCRCILATHSNTDHTHVHAFYDIRTANTGNKIQIPDVQYRTMDQRYCRAYDKRFGTNYLPDHLALKAETARWKKAYAKAKETGVPNELLPKKPERAIDQIHAKDLNERHERNAGIRGSNEFNESRLDRNKQAVATAQRFVTAAHRQIDSGERAANGIEQEFRETLAASGQLQQTITGVDKPKEQIIERANISMEVHR
jgi:hypothetical protein